jgi:UDP-N-acetylglucosamine diphosphorylase / glucose-1-phosphate thymidylyltransferase / UDP-N-acetylgalactosamine diphosphorylase / glucosamine-1-phosphate N-acetyltransferase / galactosamine-1-phosphate N-acetyltransferase
VTQSGPTRTTQAVILARGLGTRMRREAEGTSAALSDEQRRAAAQGAKGMMPLGGRPFLDYVLSALADAGIGDVTLVVAPDHGQIAEHFERTHLPARVRVRFAVQAEPRGTADAVLSVRGVVNDAPFLVLNSDNYYPVAAFRDLAAIHASGLVAFEAETLVRESRLEPERVFKFALLDIGDDDILRSVREKPSADDPLAQRAERWVSMNLWSFSPVIFEACARVRPSARGELEIQDAVTIAMRELGEPFHVVRMRAGVLDMSSRADIAFVASQLEGIEPRP